MPESTPFSLGAQRVLDALASGQAADQSTEYVSRVQSALSRAERAIVEAATNDRGLDFTKGFVAEQWHAGTYNVDLARHGHDQRFSAYTPTDASVADVVFGPRQTDPTQLKYYKTGGDTAKAISDPKYDGLDKVVPADQLMDVRQAAQHYADKNSLSRPEQAAQYEHTANTSSDRLRHQGAESRPLTEPDSRALTRDAREDGSLDRERWGLTAEQVIRLEDLAREALNAGAQAAAVSAAMSLAPVVLSAVSQLVKDDELDLDELAKLAKATPAAALKSGVSGSITAALVIASRSGMLGTPMTAVPPDAIAYTVVLAINSLQTSYRAASGEITWEQATSTMARDGFILAAAFAGATAGTALIPVPVLGSMIGSIVGATCARLIVGGAEGILLGLAVKNGWVVYGLVRQDYTLPETALAAAGIDVADLDHVELDVIDLELADLDEIDLELIESEGIPFTPLRRGLIAVGTVGYV